MDVTDTRAALEAIQELHKPAVMHRGFSAVTMCSACPAYYPCPTRKLADEALSDRMARTNQGENNE